MGVFQDGEGDFGPEGALARPLEITCFLGGSSVAKGMVRFFWFLLMVGCGSSELPVPSPCTQGVAQVKIGDGYSQVLCGCGSGSQAWVPATSSLRCELASAQTRLFLIYSGNVQTHQMVSWGSPSFASYAPTKPQERILEVQVLEFPQASTTYSFVDLFSPIHGQIIVP